MTFHRHSIKDILALLATVLIACQAGPDFDALRSEIVDLHDELIDAHLNKDLDFFVKDLVRGEVCELTHGPSADYYPA